jgi:hypothetical protein
MSGRSINRDKVILSDISATFTNIRSRMVFFDIQVKSLSMVTIVNMKNKYISNMSLSLGFQTFFRSSIGTYFIV